MKKKKQINNTVSVLNILEDMRQADSKKIFDNANNMFNFAIGSIPPLPKPATKEDIQRMLKLQKQKTATSDQEIFFNKKERQLYRQIGNKKFSYNFKEGKRFSLFEMLLDDDDFKSTENLRRALRCPSNDAVYKLVQGINRDVRARLEIKKNSQIIEGRGGLGYKIHSDFVIHEE